MRLKNYVWSHHRPLKAKGQYDFSRAYSPDHSNVPRLINIINIRYNITRHNIMQKVTPFFCNRCVFYSSSFKPNFPLDSPNSNVHFFSTFCDVNNSADTCKCRTEARAPFCLCQEHVFPILFKGATSRYFGQFRHWSNCHRINLNIKITAQNYRRTRKKHREDKKGRGWTKLERIEADCIWINLKNVSPPFFKLTVCQFIHVSNFH